MGQPLERIRPQPQLEDEDIDRDIYALSYERKLLFTKSFPISRGALPRWKPAIIEAQPKEQ